MRPAKTLLFMLFILYMMGCFLFFPEVTYSAALQSMQIFIEIIFPALFPFMVLIELFTKTKLTRIIEIIFHPIMKPLFNLPGCSFLAILLGLISGYPGGAFITVKLLQAGLLTKKEADHLISFCNNSSPIFITGAVGMGMLHNSSLGFLLLKSHIIGCIVTGLIFRFLIKKQEVLKSQNTKKTQVDWNQPTVSSAFTDLSLASFKTLKTLSLIGSTIILFGVFIKLLQQTRLLLWIAMPISQALNLLIGKSFTDPHLTSVVLAGLIELSNGIKMLSTENLALTSYLPLLGLIIGWGSVSVHFQVLSILKNSEISKSYYFAGKATHGIVAGILTFLLL